MTTAQSERSYRWTRTHAFMDDRGLDGLLVFGSDRSDRYDAGQYLGNDRRYQHLVVPRDGDPVMIGFSAQVAAQNMLSKERELDSWIDDLRIGRHTVLMPQVVEELGLAGRRLGVIGLGWGSPFAAGGWVPKPTWEAISARLEGTEFVDVTADFGLLMACRSERDQERLARAAAAGDQAVRVVRELAKPGVSERELYAAAYASMLSDGMRVTWMLMQSGIDNYAWGEPSWLIREEPSRVLEDQDIVGFEMFPTFAELNTHINGSVLVGEPPAATLRCAEIARTAYEVGRDLLAPGRSFREVAEAMEEPLAEAGAWHITPHVAALNPLLAGGGLDVGIDRQVPGFAERFPHVDAENALFDFEIQEGMTFSLQPDARLGRHWALVGGVVVATGGGCRELNEVSPHVQHGG
ncbi:M24 family metallopeptidase [Nocardioides sp. L-11A]|uniref:M24 family metallopeptidase n=1 Tax=Nocardioides sp. L-11A TaxID=3043848 RepID=UPI00249B3A58|nr:M24 family metallopeptidase [Nocardioides sp. L-11A]